MLGLYGLRINLYFFSVSGCTVEQLTTSNDTYVKWLLGYIYFGDENFHYNRLHIATPNWRTDLPYNVEYGEVNIL